jgi:hypothetical protein
VAGLLSGGGIRNQETERRKAEPLSGRGLLKGDAERQSVLHLQTLDDAVAERVEAGEELHELGLEHEVAEGGLGTRPVPRAELDLADDAGRRGEVPVGCNHLTAFIDVQANLLFYVVAAWEDDFTGYVIDYGAFPDQKRPYFTLRMPAPR